jgi:hypothetical protein
MFASTLSLTFGADTITMNRINQDAYASEYFARVGVRDFRMEIKHTIPSGRNPTPESHLVRLDVDLYDSDGVHVRTTSSWTVIRTAKAVQNDLEAANTAKAVNGFLDVTANLDKLLARQS